MTNIFLPRYKNALYSIHDKIFGHTSQKLEQFKTMQQQVDREKLSISFCIIHNMGTGHQYSCQLMNMHLNKSTWGFLCDKDYVELKGQEYNNDLERQ